MILQHRYRVRRGYLLIFWCLEGLVSLEKGHPEVLFLLGLVTTVRWSKEERAFAVEAYFSNDGSIIATQRVFRTQFNIRTGAPLPGRQSIALWVNTFRVSGNVEKNTRNLQKASEYLKTLRR